MGGPFWNRPKNTNTIMLKIKVKMPKPKTKAYANLEEVLKLHDKTSGELDARKTKDNEVDQ